MICPFFDPWTNVYAKFNYKIKTKGNGVPKNPQVFQKNLVGWLEGSKSSFRICDPQLKTIYIFFRANMIRPEYNGVRLGINKCRDAIENSLSK